MPEICKDPLTGLWVVFAPERAHRPQSGMTVFEANKSVRCPFCAGNEADTPPEVFSLRDSSTNANEPGWSVRVVPNRYPAFVEPALAKTGSRQFSKRAPAIGAHEVVIEASEHVENIATLNVDRWAQIVCAYRQRMGVLSSDSRWRYVLIFKNQGIPAGATLAHVHSQITALPLIPPQVQREVTGAKRYYSEHRLCAYCAMLKQEISIKKRLISVNKLHVVFCPVTARVPFETWIMPRFHQSLFSTLDDKAVRSLAQSLWNTFGRIDHSLSSPSFNLVIHSGPPRFGENAYYHWHVEILPRLAQPGGFEWGSGSYINIVKPEDAARMLRSIVL